MDEFLVPSEDPDMVNTVYMLFARLEENQVAGLQVTEVNRFDRGKLRTSRSRDRNTDLAMDILNQSTAIKTVGLVAAAVGIGQTQQPFGNQD